MYNLIKSEFYKLRYGKTYRGLCTLMLWCIVMTVILSINAKNVHLELISTHLNGRDYGFTVSTFLEPNNIKGLEFFASGLGWTPILLVGLMYVISMYTCDEYSNGTYKNIVSYGNKRRDIYLSKFISISISISILVFMVPLIALAIGSIINGWGVEFKFKQIVEIIKILSLNSVIFISIASVFMVIATVIKNKALVVTIGIVAVISPVFLLESIPIDTLSCYPMFMLMDTCANIPAKDFIIQIISTCSIITLVSSIVGIYIFNNQDIR